MHPAPAGLALPALAQQLRLDVGVLEHGDAGAGQLLLLVVAGVRVIVLLACVNSRAANRGPRSFHNNNRAPDKGLLLVKSVYCLLATFIKT